MGQQQHRHLKLANNDLELNIINNNHNKHYHNNQNIYLNGLNSQSINSKKQSSLLALKCCNCSSSASSKTSKSLSSDETSSSLSSEYIKRKLLKRRKLEKLKKMKKATSSSSSSASCDDELESILKDSIKQWDYAYSCLNSLLINNITTSTSSSVKKLLSESFRREHRLHEQCVITKTINADFKFKYDNDKELCFRKLNTTSTEKSKLSTTIRGNYLLSTLDDDQQLVAQDKYVREFSACFFFFFLNLLRKTRK